MTPREIQADHLDLRAFVRPGDRILVAEGCGEPLTLVEALVRQRHDLGGVHVFVGLGLGSRLRPDCVDGLRMESYGALGQTRKLADAGLLSIHPVALSDFPRLMDRGEFRVDVVLTSVAPESDDGYPLGLTALLVPAAIRNARTVIAEVNARVPQTFGAAIRPSRIAAVVPSDIPPIMPPSVQPDATTEAIAAHVAALVDDGATLQLGVGAIPDAVCRLLRDRRDLGIHSGMLSDGLVDLMQRGAVTNRLKANHRGVSLVSAVLGSADTQGFVHRNPEVRLEGVEITHDASDLEPSLVAINGALEVDLWGQVNAEAVGGRYIGAIGGQPQFSRAGLRATSGASIIALPSSRISDAEERSSRIIARPVERVTTPWSAVGMVVTEFGVAHLAGRDIEARRIALAEIAHPDFRSELRRARLA